MGASGMAVVSQGRDILTQFMGGLLSPHHESYYIVLGTGTTAVTDADEDVETYLYDTILTASYMAGPDLIYEFSTGSTVTLAAFTEVCLYFGTYAAGTMLSRTIITPTPKDAGVLMTFEIKLTLAAA